MSPRIQILVLLATLASTVLVGIELRGLRSGLDLLVRSGVDVTQHASASWREVDGVAFSVRTYRNPSEDATEFVRRHADAVLAMGASITGRSPDTERRHEGR